MSKLSFITANARSLAPKMNSLIAHFTELELQFALISESWLKDCPALENDKVDLEAGQGLKMILNNRKSRRNKTAGGGVAIVYDENKIRLREWKRRKSKSEIVCARGKLPGLKREILIISIYVPPKIKAKQTGKFMEELNRIIAINKEEMCDPNNYSRRGH